MRISYIETLISKELLNITSNEIKKISDNQLSKTLISKASLLIKKALEETNSFEILIDLFNKEENLSKLKKTLSLFSFLNDNIEDLQIIDKLRLSKLDNKLYVYIWLGLKFNEFKKDEYSEYELINFLTEIFEKYEWLMKIHILFDNFPGLYCNNGEDVCMSEAILKVFVNASKKYPDVTSIKEMLILAYYSRAEYDKSLELIELSLNTTEINRGIHKYQKIYYLTLRAEIFFKQNKLDEALTDANYIINKIGHYSVFRYVEVFLLRISINLKKNNIKQLNSDCLTLIGSLGIRELSDLHINVTNKYPEAVSYIEKHIDKIKKLYTSKNNTFSYVSEIGEIKILGDNDYQTDSLGDAFFNIKLKNKKRINIELQHLIEDDCVTGFEVLYDDKLTEDEKNMVITWLSSPCLISEKNIGYETTNYQYIYIHWRLLEIQTHVGEDYFYVGN